MKSKKIINKMIIWYIIYYNNKLFNVNKKLSVSNSLNTHKTPYLHLPFKIHVELTLFEVGVFINSTNYLLL